MKQKIFIKLLEIISKIANKAIIYFEKNEYNAFGMTAVKSSLGFWYVGNVFDYADMAYSISNNGVVEKEETNLVVRIINKMLEQDALLGFYDIGANTGYYGILAGWLGRERVRAYSFEPLHEHVNCLEETIVLNRLESTVFPYEVALSDTNALGKIATAGTGSSLELDFLDDINVPQREIELKKLDDFAKEKIMIAPDFMKIDVEGHELKVLNGAAGLIVASLPVVFIEIAYSLKSIGRGYINNNYIDTFSFFEKIGYMPFLATGDRVIAYDFKKPIDGIQMFLFIHPIKHNYIFELLNIK